MEKRIEMQGRDAEIKAMIRATLERARPMLRGHRVFLFGSRAGGESGARSDFDIGVIGAEPLPLRDFYAIEDMLDELPTLYRIDWVDLNRVSPDFLRRAMSRTELLYE